MGIIPGCYIRWEGRVLMENLGAKEGKTDAGAGLTTKKCPLDNLGENNS